MRQKFLSIFLFVISIKIAISAQETVRVCGDYTYMANEYEAPVTARKMALEHAKINALGQLFGTDVTGETSLNKIEENGVISATFRSFTGTRMRGEWIADAMEPIYHEPKYERGMRLYRVEVCGYAREIKSAGTDFSAKILRNGTDQKAESKEFKHEDDIFLLFSAPVDGYLAVYLIEDVYDDTKKAFCLLPYMSASGEAVKINRGKEYIFFSQKHAEKSEAATVNEYTMTADKQIEYNQIYIIFSTKPFAKANDKEAGSNLPRYLTYNEFRQWLIRNTNTEMEIKELTVRK